MDNAEELCLEGKGAWRLRMAERILGVVLAQMGGDTWRGLRLSSRRESEVERARAGHPHRVGRGHRKGN